MNNENNLNTNDNHISDEQLKVYLDSLSEEEKAKLVKKIDHLQFTDQVMFPMIMNNKETCIEVLSRLINKNITEIGVVEPEKTYKNLPGLRGIRLDVYVEDENARYDIEMQVYNNHDLPKRCRCIQSNIDANILKEGADFNKIKDTYIIFICMYDPFNLGLPKYTLNKSFKEARDYEYQDGTKLIVYNATAYSKADNEKIAKFLRYCVTAKPSDNLTEAIHNKVQILRNNEGWRKDVMTFELRDAILKHESKLEGKLEGKQENKIEIAKNMLDLNLEIEVIAKSTGLSIEEIQKLKNNTDITE